MDQSMQDDTTQPGTPTNQGTTTSEFRGRSPGPYKPGTSWKTWLRLFINYLSLRKVEREKEKRLFLLQEIGMSNYELVDSLLQGKLPEETPFADLCKLLESHFQPKKLLMAERFKLASMSQRPEQTLQQYYADLQKEAANCGFEKITDFRDAQVTLFFIGGISSVETRKRLLEKEEMTSKEALEIAEAFERVGVSAPHLKEGNRPVGIGKVQGFSQRGRGGKDRHTHNKTFPTKGKFQSKPVDPSTPNPRPTCTVCGKKGHVRDKCYVRQCAFCSHCKRPGHMLTACISARKAKHKSRKGVNLIEQEESSDEDDDFIHQITVKVPFSNSRTSSKDIFHNKQYNSRVTPRVSNRLLRGPREITISRGESQDVSIPCVRDVSIPRFRDVSTSRVRDVSIPRDIPQVFSCSEKISKRDARVDSIPRSTVRPDPAIMLPFYIDDVETLFELDTGSTLSIINLSTWKEIGKPPLIPTETSATAYNNSPIQFCGKVVVSAAFGNKVEIVELQVIDLPVKPICGRDMIRLLKINLGPHYRAVVKSQKRRINHLKSTEPTFSAELTRLLQENKSLFLPGLGKCVTTQASLKFKDDKPVPKFNRARPVPFALRPKVEAKLEEMVQSGTLIQVEHSEWATPLVVVPKPGGKIRLCGDYKVTVNPQLDINQYPLPVPDDMFHQLQGGQKFSKMDLSDAYMQVELDKDSRKYTTINTHKGMFEYTRVPFGVASAPAIFQRIMETTLAGIEGVLVYLDDITVTAPDDKTHLHRLGEVMSRLNSAGFRLKRDKCEFMKSKIEFLGHVVDGDGIRPSPEKLKAMINMPAPKNLKEVESFIGMVQYYGKFIPGLSTLAAPLNVLRKQGVVFKWEKEQQQAFQTIKQRLTKADVLTHYDPKVPVILATDASDYGLGAVIYHKYSDNTEKVIAYASRSLTKSERNYAQIEKEALGIVYGVEKFNQFLYGRKFTLLTDHQPLVKIFGPKLGLPVIAAKRLHRWGLRLMVYSFDIEYRNTNEFGNADGLSRLPDPRELPSAETVINEIKVTETDREVLENLPFTAEELAKATSEDPILKEVAKYIQNGWPKKVDEPFKAYSRKEEMRIYQGCILWDMRVIIPQKFRKKALNMLHSSHYGRNRMVALARTKLWYPGIDKDIELMVKSCATCAIFGNNPKRTPLHPWEEPAIPWQRLHMDFCETEGANRWLIVVDAKSKWPCVVKMTSTTASKMCDKLSQIFATHGLPEEIVSDNGPQFTSAEFREFCKQRNIEQTLTPPYHPNSNGEAERFVQTFKKGFYKNIKSGHSTDSAVTKLLFQYRVTPHPATGKSPAEGLMGRKLRTVLDVFKHEQKTIPNNKYRENMKKFYDKGKLPRKEFHVGQECYIRNYNPKGDIWFPGIITAKYSTHTYEVNYGTGSRKAHIDQLKQKLTMEEELTVVTLPKKQRGPTLAHKGKPQTTKTAQPATTTVFRRSTRTKRPPERLGIDETVIPKKRSRVQAVKQMMYNTENQYGHTVHLIIHSPKKEKEEGSTGYPLNSIPCIQENVRVGDVVPTEKNSRLYMRHGDVFSTGMNFELTEISSNTDNSQRTRLSENKNERSNGVSTELTPKTRSICDIVNCYKMPNLFYHLFRFIRQSPMNDLVAVYDGNLDSIFRLQTSSSRVPTSDPGIPTLALGEVLGSASNLPNPIRKEKKNYSRRNSTL